MSFNFRFKDIEEEREIPNDNYKIEDLIKDLNISSQSIVCKQNGELVIEESVINDGDDIQLVQIIYGG